MILVEEEETGGFIIAGAKERRNGESVEVDRLVSCRVEESNILR